MIRQLQVKRRLERLDAQRDHLEIVQLIANYDFPWDTTRALEFALFRTYGVPSVGALLDATHEFGLRPQKRYDDTDLILSEIIENGYDSERGRAAIRRMNGIHGHFKITNDDFLYVLSTFVVEPPRWVRRFGYRTQSEKELQAWHRFWREVGTRMAIQGIPDDYHTMAALGARYEAERFAYTDGGRRVADSTLDMFLSWYVPKALFPAFRPVLRCLMDDTLLDAFGYPHPPRALRAAVNGGMRLRSWLMRFVPLPERPRRRTYRKPILSYPGGYELDKLGAVPEPGIDAQWLRAAGRAADTEVLPK